MRKVIRRVPLFYESHSALCPRGSKVMEPEFENRPDPARPGVVQIIKTGEKHVHVAYLECTHCVKDAAIGSEVACEDCTRQEKAVEILRAGLAAGIVSHTRADRNEYAAAYRRKAGQHAQITVYRYDSKSPTGVLALCGVEETEEVKALLRGALSPLSPTESR
jgi:hypothetical protein